MLLALASCLLPPFQMCFASVLLCACASLLPTHRWRYALAKIKKEPLQILTIPVSAACVGWITNKVGG